MMAKADATAQPSTNTPAARLGPATPSPEPATGASNPACGATPCEAPDPLSAFDAIPEDLRVTINLEGADENVGDFALEAREHLANAETAVLALESGATDPEQVNIVFRAFHTIKGVAGFLNLARIVEVAHAAEFLLDKVRSNKLALTPAVLELVLASSDMLGQLIGMLSGGEAARERELKLLVHRLEAACEGRFFNSHNTQSTSTTATVSTVAPANLSGISSRSQLPQPTSSRSPRPQRKLPSRHLPRQRVRPLLKPLRQLLQQSNTPQRRRINPSRFRRNAWTRS
jgi:chemotaxis protein histidine kinase CheA